MQISAERLTDALVGAGDSRGPLYQRLASGLLDLIADGELPPGCGLPSERMLAAASRLSRTTVVAAYRHLQEIGAVERREGSGTRVAIPSAEDRRVVSAPPGAGRVSRYLFRPPTTIDLATAALPGLDLVAREMANLGGDDYRRLVETNIEYDPRGLPSLRERVAEQFTARGTPTTPDQILITAGAQQALEVVTTGCLRPGDPVIVERPAYRGALEIFARAECAVEGVRIDTDGIVTSELDAALRHRPARMIYVQSGVQNPTGVHLSASRGRRLVEAAARAGSIIVDDTSLADTSFSDAIPPALPEEPARLITIGSMNKTFWSGLRIGWIRGASDVISQLAQMKGLPDFGTSVLSQRVATRLLDRIDEARAARRADLRRSYEIATGLLRELVPGWSWWEPSGGPSLWVEIPSGDSAEFAAEAMQYGVAVLPASAFSPGGLVSRHLRIPYALPDGRLAPGLERLARAWREYERRGPARVLTRSVST